MQQSTQGHDSKVKEQRLMELFSGYGAYMELTSVMLLNSAIDLQLSL